MLNIQSIFFNLSCFFRSFTFLTSFIFLFCILIWSYCLYIFWLFYYVHFLYYDFCHKISTTKGIRHRRFKMSERYQLNKELAQMLKGGVIMDVTTPEQAIMASEVMYFGEITLPRSRLFMTLVKVNRCGKTSLPKSSFLLRISCIKQYY